MNSENNPNLINIVWDTFPYIEIAERAALLSLLVPAEAISMVEEAAAEVAAATTAAITTRHNSNLNNINHNDRGNTSSATSDKQQQPQ